MKILRDIYTVGNDLGIYIEGLDMLVVADLHIGYEGALQEQGIYLPITSYPKMKQAIERMQQATQAQNILIDGDLKHEFGGASRQEWRETLDLLSFLKKKFEEIRVVRGNHDNYLIPILKKEKIELYDPHYREDSYLFMHGHKQSSEVYDEDVETVILGHEHPAITFREEFGVKRKFKAILYRETDLVSIIVLPVLSPLMTGNEMNGIERNKLLSPYLKQAEIQEFIPIIVDQEAGVYKFPRLKNISYK